MMRAIRPIERLSFNKKIKVVFFKPVVSKHLEGQFTLINFL